jgi:hypothetical protein
MSQAVAPLKAELEAVKLQLSKRDSDFVELQSLGADQRKVMQELLLGFADLKAGQRQMLSVAVSPTSPTSSPCVLAWYRGCAFVLMFDCCVSTRKSKAPMLRSTSSSFDSTATPPVSSVMDRFSPASALNIPPIVVHDLEDTFVLGEAEKPRCLRFHREALFSVVFNPFLCCVASLT